MRIICVIALMLLTTVASNGQAKKYILVMLNKNPSAEKISDEEAKKIGEGHMANIGKLASEGKLVAAGPFEGGGGIFVLNTTSKTEAAEWISTDPGVQAKRWDIELLPFTQRSGSICKLSAPYNMVMYSFVRFDAIVSKFTSSTYPQIIRSHDEYLKKLNDTGNVVTEGIFGENDGGIVIMKGKVDKSVFETDPGVQEGLLEISIKDLYIAKGSFCEK